MVVSKKKALYALFFLSGIAGLGYEILWTRMLSAGLGHEIISVFAVVCAFFSGLSLGAWLLDRPISKSANPEKWYALLECIIGVWALILIFLLPTLNREVSGLIGAEPSAWRHWAVSFLYPLIILLPATASMGATLPAMDRILEKSEEEARAVAGLYSVNTLGAVTGIVLVTFCLLPLVGMNVTSVALILVNFLGAAGVWIIAQKKSRKGLDCHLIQGKSERDYHLYVVLFITGLAGIGFEVLIIRALSQILENTVFSFASMLIVFLLGTAIGAALYQQAFKGRENDRGLLSALLLSNACSCLVAIYLLQHLGTLFNWLQQTLGGSPTGAVFAETILSIVFFLIPTVFMGAIFSHLATTLRGRRGGVGRALSLNTLGGAFAPLLFGIFLLPKIGLYYALLIVPIAYLLCFPRRRLFYGATAGLLMVVAVVLGIQSDSSNMVTLEKGETLLSHSEGVMASVSVIEDDRGERHLKVNNTFQMGGTTSLFSDKRQAYFPLLLHPSPEKALFLGVGTGTTFAAAADFPGVISEGVELIPEVIEELSYFEKATGDISENESLNIYTADARRYVNAVDKKYDVIVADLFHPARDGAGSLYTLEHFSAIKERLTEDGLFCQWLPLYQLDLETLKIIIRTFLKVYPQGQAFLAHYSIEQPIIGLVGSPKALQFSENWYRKRVAENSMRRQMAGFGYDSIYSLLGTFLAGREGLLEFSGPGPVNKDELPLVTFRAPLFVYGNPESASKRLLTLLDALSTPDPESILSEVITEEDYIARPRLKAYWTARDSFLKLGTSITRTSDVRRLYETTSQPLLKVVRQSFDFSAAYFPLISIAYEMYPYDRDASYQLLKDLEHANPRRPEARRLRERLFLKEPS